MDCTKFIDLLSSSKIYFRRIDKLPDPFEGTITPNIIKSIFKRYENIDDFYMSKNEIAQRSVNDILHMEKYKKYTLVNCWTQNVNESYALWKIYLAGQPFGVSIQTKYSKLKNSFVDDNFNFHFQKVYYSHKVKSETVTSVYFRKNKFYEFEKEVRVALLYQWEKYAGEPKFDEGTSVNVDLSKIIEKIYVSPFAPKYFYEFIEYLVYEKFNYSFPIIKSKIKEQY